MSIKIMSIRNAEHYKWGDNCDGWFLLNHSELTIIKERVPPGAGELNHYHNFSQQFFYILKGVAKIITDADEFVLEENEAVEIPPKLSHQLKNNSDSDLEFLVISCPKSHGDKIIVE